MKKNEQTLNNGWKLIVSDLREEGEDFTAANVYGIEYVVNAIKILIDDFGPTLTNTYIQIGSDVDWKSIGQLRLFLECFEFDTTAKEIIAFVDIDELKRSSLESVNIHFNINTDTNNGKTTKR